jgi:hypothetical protein
MSHEDELTAGEREVETSLRSLRPTPANLDHVALALADNGRIAPGHWRARHFAAAAVAIFAIGGAWLIVRPGANSANVVKDRVPIIEPDIFVADAHIEAPTVLAYRRALAQSPAELEALLDRQAVTGTASDTDFTPARVLTLGIREVHPTLGDM